MFDAGKRKSPEELLEDSGCAYTWDLNSKQKSWILIQRTRNFSGNRQTHLIGVLRTFDPPGPNGSDPPARLFAHMR